MPADGARALLLVAMIVILPGAGLLLLISLVGLLGGAENTEVSHRQFPLLALAAAVGLVATVVAIYGLAARSRPVTAVAALAQGCAAVFVFVLWVSGFGVEQGDDVTLFGLFVVMVVALVMLLVARAPARYPGRRTTRVRPPSASETPRPRKDVLSGCRGAGCPSPRGTHA